jgi:hypothetical protein
VRFWEQYADRSLNTLVARTTYSAGSIGQQYADRSLNTLVARTTNSAGSIGQQYADRSLNTLVARTTYSAGSIGQQTLSSTPKKSHGRDSQCTIRTVKIDIRNHLELFIQIRNMTI